MAREAGFEIINGGIEVSNGQLERFAALVAEATKAQPQDHIRDVTKKVQGEWVDLTDDEIAQAYCDRPSWVGFVKAIIAKFKEKNTPPVVPQGEPVGYWNGKETAWFEHELCGHPAPDDCTIPLYTAPPSSQLADALVEAAIAETKEKAAQICDDKHDYMCSRAAAAIRSMK
jgi:hypothetical protein